MQYMRLYSQRRAYITELGHIILAQSGPGLKYIFIINIKNAKEKMKSIIIPANKAPVLNFLNIFIMFLTITIDYTELLFIEI